MKDFIVNSFFFVCTTILMKFFETFRENLPCKSNHSRCRRLCSIRRLSNRSLDTKHLYKQLNPPPT